MVECNFKKDLGESDGDNSALYTLINKLKLDNGVNDEDEFGDSDDDEAFNSAQNAWERKTLKNQRREAK